MTAGTDISAGALDAGRRGGAPQGTMPHETMMQRLRSARTIGLFGGTFDPVHLGHLLLAECAADELALDTVVFMPACIPPHKINGRRITPAQHRLGMLAAAIAANDRFVLSTFEIDAQTISYTVDTLRWIHEAFPAVEPVLLLGGDSVRDMHTWHRPEEIARLASIAVWERPGIALPPEVLPGVGYRRIPAPLVSISSTDIRERVAAGRSVRYRLPDSVIDYIQTHAIYR